MRKLTKDDLEVLLQGQIFGLADISPLSRLYGLATDILIQIFGYEWVFDNIFGRRPLDEFLRSNPQSKEDRFKMTDRSVEAAEILFNLQNISGIETIVESIRKSSIEANVAELQSAKLLFFSGTPFYFNIPSGNKGLDFDAVATVNGLRVPCEFKCKLETTDVNKNTIKQVLSGARKQLPRDDTSVIFLKIPENWTVPEGTEELLNSAIDDFLRGTTRINSVVYYWEEWDYQKSGRALRSVRFNEIVNPNSKVKLGRILKKPGAQKLLNEWTYLNHIVQGVFGESGVTRMMPSAEQAGFSWHAVLKILPQVSKGEHVIYEMGLRDAERISLLIDKNDHIKLEIVDSSGRNFHVESKIPFYKIGLEVFAYLRFQIATILNFSEISIFVNNEIVGKKTIPLNQSTILPNGSLGGDLRSNRRTAFIVTEVRAFEESSNALNRRVTEYFNRKFALDIPI